MPRAHVNTGGSAGGNGEAQRLALILMAIMGASLVVLLLGGAVAWSVIASRNPPNTRRPLPAGSSASDPGPCASSKPNDCRVRCVQGDPPSCRTLGTLQENGRGTVKNVEAAAYSHRQACDGGDMLGCAYLGLLYAEGRGVPRDPGRASALFDRACRGGEPLSCARLRAGEGVVANGTAPSGDESPDASVTEEDVRVSGRLPVEVIQRVVRQHHRQFRRCYEDGLVRDPDLRGRVVVRLVIGGDGRVSTALNGGSNLPDEAVVDCVVRASRAITFPPPEGGIVTVVYPIVFSPR